MPALASLIAAPTALLVLAAHFWRAGEPALTSVALVLVALVFVKRPWAARTIQIALVLGAIEWLRTLAALVAERHAAGLPFVRLALILGVVAIATALCALAFQARTIRARYRFGDTSEAISGAR